MKQRESAQKSLQFYCQNQLHLKSKIALLTFDKLQYSCWAERLLLIFEYAQLLSQGLLLFIQISGKTFVERVVVYFFKLVNLSSLLEFEGSSSVAWSVIIMMLILTGLKYLLAIYVVCIAHWNLKGGPRVFLSTWRWVFKVQGRFLYYFMTSFWTFTILNIQKEGSERIQESKAVVTTLLSILIGIEFIFSIFMETQFCNFLPGKNFLSAKNYEMQIATLIQKFVLQVFQLSLNSEALKTYWVYSIMNLIFSLWRVKRFYQKLPMYRSEALDLLGGLINLAFALSITSFIGVILKAGDWFKMTMQSIIIIWILLSPFAIYINRGILFHQRLRLLTYENKYKPALLLGKIFFTKEIEKALRIPEKRNTSKYHSSYLFQTTQDAHFAAVSYQKLDSKEDYFEDQLLRCKQEDPLIKLYIAKLWFKKFGIISKALKMVGEITKKPWSKEYTSALLVLNLMQKRYFSREERQASLFNFVEYTENQRILSEVKIEMIQQAQLKVDVCRNILSEVPDLGEIFENAQRISKLKRITQKKIDKLMETIPDYCIYPLLVCSQYYLILEYSSNKSQKYQEIYTQKVLKYKSCFSSSSIMKENIYQDVNAYFILGGGEKSENGIIKYCSKSVENLCGGDRQSYILSHISMLFMPSMQSFYKDFFQSILDQGDMSLLQNVQRAFLHNKKGYMFEANFYLWIHPYISDNLYLDMLMRPVKSQNEYLLIKHNGDIEGATEKISKNLDVNFMMLKKPLSIKLFSEELFDANQAFNTVGRRAEIEQNLVDQPKVRRRSRRLSQTPAVGSTAHTQALEIFNSFSIGKEVMVFPLKENKASGIKYHCQIVKIATGPASPKLIILTKANHNNEEEEEEELVVENDNFLKVDIEEIPCEIENDPPIMTTEGNALFSARSGSQLELISPWKKMIQYNFAEQKELEEKERPEEDLRDFISTSLNSLKVDDEKQSYKALKKALNRKTYSNFFKILCTGFYTIFIITLLSQLMLKKISESTMSDLVVKKNLLNYAQTRSYYACKMPYAIGGAYLMSIGIEVAEFLPDVYIAPKTQVAIFQTYYKGLVTANTNIIQLLRALDNEIYPKLFQSDVRVFGSIYDVDDESFINVTSFQTVGDLGLPVKYLSNLEDPGSSVATAALTFVRKNVANDFLTKNLEITEIFQDSVDDQRDSLRLFVSLCTILSPLLLVGVALSLSVIIWIQYSKEKHYMQAFIKLQPRSVKLCLEIVESFKQALIDDDSFEDKKAIESFWNKSNLLEKVITNRHYSNLDFQVVSTKKMKRRYWLFIIQMIIYIGVLIGVLLWNFLTLQDALDIIYHKQSQLQLSNHISERVSINMMGIIEMFVSNNTLNITQIPPLNHTIQAVAETKQLTMQMIEGFLDLDGGYDPSTKKILFEGEACDAYESYYVDYCKALNKNGILTNLVSLVSFFKDLLENKLEIYSTIDRSSMLNLVVNLYSLSNVVSPGVSLLVYQAQRLNKIIDEQLTTSIDDADKQQSLIIIIFVVTFIIVSLLIWIQILSKVRELNNDFKKVLQILPPKLVLSSFLLKHFLNKISTSNLEI